MTKLKTFYCLKCGERVELVYLYSMADETFTAFNARLNAGLCNNCYKPVKKEVSCLH